MPPRCLFAFVWLPGVVEVSLLCWLSRMALTAALLLVLSWDRVERPIEEDEPIAEGSSPEPGAASGFDFLCSKAAIKCPTA